MDEPLPQPGAAVRCNEELWENLHLPAWDVDRLYALFLRFSGQAKPPLTRPEDEEFTLRLCYAIGIQYANKRWTLSLRRDGLDPGDVAQDMLLHLRRKAPRMVLKSPGPVVMMGMLNTTMGRFIQDKRDGCKKRVVYGADLGSKGPAAERQVGENRAAPQAAPEVEGLLTLLRSEEAEDAVLRDIPGNVLYLLALYRHQRHQIYKHGRLISWWLLPPWLRRRVVHEQHNLVTSRLRRIVREFAASPCRGAA